MSLHVYLGVGAYIVLVLVVGYAALYGLGLVRTSGALKLIGLAYLVGWALLGITLSYSLMLGVSFDRESIVAASLIVVLLCVTAGRRTGAVPVAATRLMSRSPMTLLIARMAGAILAATCVCAAIVGLRSNWAPDYDAFLIWLPHAQTIYYHHGLWAGTPGGPLVFHPEYPPLVSAVYAAIFVFAGGFHPALLPALQCLLGLSFLGSLLVLLSRCAPSWLVLPSLALLAVSPGFFDRIDSLLPDQSLAYLVGASVLTCTLWLRERRGAWLVLSIGLGAAASLTKVEGVSYALVLAVVVCGGALALREWRTFVPAVTLFIAAAAIAPWQLWLRENGRPTSSDDYRLSNLLHPGYLAHRLGRVQPAVDWVLRIMFRPDQWTLILPLVLVALVAAARDHPRLVGAAGVWLLATFTGLIVVYWIGQFPGLTEQDELDTSAYRVASTVVIVAGSQLALLLDAALERRVLVAQHDSVTPGG